MTKVKSRAYEVTNQAGVAQIKLIKGFSWWEDNSVDFTEKIETMLNQGITRAEVYINSPGGSMTEANEIVNQLKRFAEVKVKLGAIAASAASKVACEFSDVEAAPNLQWMMHDPALPVYAQHVEDFDSSKALYVNLRNEAIEVYAKKSGKTKEVIEEMMRKTTWLNAKQAKEEGFVNRIAGEDDDTMPEDTAEVLASMNSTVPDVINQAIKNPNKIQSMKKIAAKLGLPENATEDQILAAMEANTQGGKATNEDKAVKAVVALAKSKGMNVEKIEKLAKADFDTTMALVEEAPAATGDAGDTTRLSDVVATLTKGNTTKPVAMGLEEMMKKNPAAVTSMIKDKPEDFKKAFEAEYGYAPSNEEISALKSL